MSKDIGLNAQDVLATSSIGEHFIVTEMDRIHIYSEPKRDLVKTINWNAPLTPSGQKSESQMILKHHEVAKEVGEGKHIGSEPKSVKDELKSVAVDEIAEPVEDEVEDFVSAEVEK